MGPTDLIDDFGFTIYDYNGFEPIDDFRFKNWFALAKRLIDPFIIVNRKSKIVNRKSNWWFVLQIANVLSWSRIFATPVVMFLLWADSWGPGYLIAAVVFALAEITDILDGYFARRQNTVSNLGIFLDLTADKLFTAGVLVMMAERQILSAWLIGIILGREFLITGVRTYAAAEGVVIPAGKWGKWKTVLTGVSLTWLIVWADAVRTNGVLHDAAQNWKIGDIKVLELFLSFSWPLVYLMVLITVYSGYLYMRDAAYLFRDDSTKGKPRSASAQEKPEKTGPDNPRPRVVP